MRVRLGAHAPLGSEEELERFVADGISAVRREQPQTYFDSAGHQSRHLGASSDQAAFAGQGQLCIGPTGRIGEAHHVNFDGDALGCRLGVVEQERERAMLIKFHWR